MATMKALRQMKYAEPLQMAVVPVPRAEPGTAIVKIAAASLISYIGDIYNGKRRYPYPTPLTAGSSAIGRIHELGPDSTSLQKGQLVFVSIIFRSRDEPTHAFLSAIYEGDTPGSKKLMSHFRDGAFAEYMVVPLESCMPINEDRLLKPVEQGGLGYQIPELLNITENMVPYGGLSDIQLRPGETIIVAPATGSFGGAAVHVALSMGTRVIAMGRNKQRLDRLMEKFAPLYPRGRLTTVAATGNLDEEMAAIKKAAGGTPIDAFFDISPPHAAGATYFTAAIKSLRHSARISLMGGQLVDITIPIRVIMHGNMTLKGKWMYERSDVGSMMRLIENEQMLMGKKGGLDPWKAFKLEDWQDAFKHAEENGGGVGTYFEISK